MHWTPPLVLTQEQFNSYRRLFGMYRTLAKGIKDKVLSQPIISAMKSEIHQLERDLGLQK